MMLGLAGPSRCSCGAVTCFARGAHGWVQLEAGPTMDTYDNTLHYNIAVTNDPAHIDMKSHSCRSRLLQARACCWPMPPPPPPARATAA